MRTESNECTWPHLRDRCSDGGRAWLTIREVHHSHTSISIAGDHSSFLTAAKPALLSKTHAEKRYTMKTCCMRHRPLLAKTLNAGIYCSCIHTLGAKQTLRLQNPFFQLNPNTKMDLSGKCYQQKETSLFFSGSQPYSPAVCQTHIAFRCSAVCGQRLYLSPGYLCNRLLPKAKEKENRRQKVT